MGQFSTEIYNPPGSTLSGNQQSGTSNTSRLTAIMRHGHQSFPSQSMTTKTTIDQGHAKGGAKSIRQQYTYL